MMTPFPPPRTLRPIDKPSTMPGAFRPGMVRDILWGRPLFKAPALPIPNIAPDLLPVPVARITRRSPRA